MQSTSASRLVPVRLVCKICGQPKDRVLDVPTGVETTGHEKFYCSACCTGSPYGTPRELGVIRWIETVAKAGWSCTFCSRGLNLENLACYRRVNSPTQYLPCCHKCKGEQPRRSCPKAAKSNPGIGHEMSSEAEESFSGVLSAALAGVRPVL